MRSPGSAIAFALFFSVVKESDAQEKSHAKVYTKAQFQYKRTQQEGRK
jgi:hypothetical protein